MDWVEVVARVPERRVLAEVRLVVRRVAAALRLLRDAVPVVVRRVVRLGAGFCVPEVLVAILLSCSRLDLVWEMIEHVFVHDRLARVTAPSNEKFVNER